MVNSTLNSVIKFFLELNKAYQSIKFTKESETSNQLSFLDVLIVKKDRKFTTKVYRKPTFNNNYLNFQSFCSKRRKIGLIKTLYSRAQKICSPEYLSDEINNIKSILKLNGYPEMLVNRVIKSQSTNSNIVKPYGPDKCPILLKLPYIGVESKLIEKKIVDITSKTYHAVNPRVLFMSKPILQRSGKDLMTPQEKSLVVYKFKCCCDSSYIGQTSRHLITRIKEHVPKCITSYIKDEKDEKSIAVENAIKKSAIAEHLVNNPSCGKKFAVSNFSVMRQCSNTLELIRLEAILIHLDKPNLCKKKEFDYTLALFS